MARRRWGDQFSENLLTDSIAALSFAVFVAIFWGGSLAFAIIFGLSLMSGIAPEPLASELNAFVTAVIHADTVRLASKISLITAAATVLLLTAIYTIGVGLNEVDKIWYSR